MKSKKVVKKMQEGGPMYPIREVLGNKAKKTKTKETSPDGNYKTKTVTKTYSGPDVYGTKEKIKSRRTAKGILNDVEPGVVTKFKNVTKYSDRTGIIPKGKYGGSTKKKK
jgi:hypothetical protein